MKLLQKYLPGNLKEYLKSKSIIISTFPLVRLYYVFKLRRMIKKKDPVCLHLGCGPRHIKEWINIDVLFYFSMPDILLDLSKKLPIKDGCVDYIYSEDFIEHIPQDKAKELLTKCYRVLKKGGVIRLLTPDLESFIKAYVNRSEKDLEWYKEGLGCETFGEMFNAGMRAWGHTFLYDRETLFRMLESIGFSVEEKSFNISSAEEFNDIDLRNSNDGSHTLYIECTKK